MVWNCVESFLVTTVWQPGSDLPRRYWALPNSFRTNQGHCASCQKKWGHAATDVTLWQMPNDVTYCQQLPTVQAAGGRSDCTQLITLLPNGWRHTARKCTRQQQQQQQQQQRHCVIYKMLIDCHSGRVWSRHFLWQQINWRILFYAGYISVISQS